MDNPNNALDGSRNAFSLSDLRMELQTPPRVHSSSSGMSRVGGRGRTPTATTIDLSGETEEGRRSVRPDFESDPRAGRSATAAPSAHKLNSLAFANANMNGNANTPLAGTGKKQEVKNLLFKKLYAGQDKARTAVMSPVRAIGGLRGLGGRSGGLGVKAGFGSSEDCKSFSLLLSFAFLRSLPFACYFLLGMLIERDVC